ncbi:hypothetical protein HIM_06994 [Hirsutella minnesotensis 3608]|uniref:Extracellular membrane protein CFEM domain-containing protein n=1 Tax=Hirsutella minnesotensis 3608 TaxID=1043627 RepID=A0A0F7ZIF9_9HYPO|nr:hypothetical protein HIM_06994 [Hirsutella minnesotensis 3608]
MKAAVASLLVAGVAQASQHNTMAAQDVDRMMGIQVGDFMQTMGIMDNFPKELFQKVKCVAPCLIKATKKISCGGKDLVSTACDNVDKVKNSSEKCITSKNCGVDGGLINLVARKAKEICQSRNSYGGGGEQGGYGGGGDKGGYGGDKGGDKGGYGGGKQGY